jgi:multicomponent Na+:H+ antiporter subunit B
MTSDSIILQAAARILKPLMILFSIFLLLRGHNEPGGGFVGGLMAAVAFCLNGLSFSPDSARETLYFDPRSFIGTGLLAAAASGMYGLVSGAPYFTGGWGEALIPGIGTVKLGTPLLFDLGVYLVVMGVTLTIFFELMEERYGT